MDRPTFLFGWSSESLRKWNKVIWLFISFLYDASRRRTLVLVERSNSCDYVTVPVLPSQAFETKLQCAWQTSEREQQNNKSWGAVYVLRPHCGDSLHSVSCPSSGHHGVSIKSAVLVHGKTLLRLYTWKLVLDLLYLSITYNCFTFFSWIRIHFINLWMDGNVLHYHVAERKVNWKDHVWSKYRKEQIQSLGRIYELSF